MSAIGALTSALPRTQRFNPTDIVLPIDSLSRTYPLCMTMAALFANSSIALNSVAGEDVDFALATAGVSPTVIIASSQTMAEYHDNIMRPHTGIISSLGRWLQARTLDAGNMPTRNVFSQLARVSPTSELSLDELRLLCISHRIDGDPAVHLTSEQLTDLRIFTGARLVYALTGPGVAGAIAQTNAFDYRCLPGPSHFGAPLSSTEITLTNIPEDSPYGTEEGQVRRVKFRHFHIELTFTSRSPSLALLLSVAPSLFLNEAISARTIPWNCLPERINPKIAFFIAYLKLELPGHLVMSLCIFHQ